MSEFIKESSVLHNSFQHSRIRGRRSSALVIVLAALVLVSTILLFFFNQSTLNRQISFSSAGQYRADLVAHTAIDTVAGDLRTEIAVGSTAYTSNNITIYIPTNNLAAVPSRVADQGFPNLLKQSASGDKFWSGTQYDASVISPIRSAANNNTTTPSASGQYINIKQWNKPGLLGDPGTGTTPTLPAAYTTAPDWVLVTRQGAVSSAGSLPIIGPGLGTLSDKSTNNPNYVVGRYAYAIYDEGGLLDINVAGFPNTLSSTDFSPKRGTLPQVDLANVPGVLDANSLVQWRNQTTAASASAYTNYVFTATNGFASVAPGDQTFVSRKDLINYINANSSVVQSSALQYLGTSTRELNAPSYTPDPARPSPDNVINPSLINIRVAGGPFTRASDATTAQTGEPLIKYRFPLSYIGFLGNNNSATGDTPSAIYKFFGLTRSSASQPWVYQNNASSILTLSQVAALTPGREPDFFELLQAAILKGSLGKTGANFFANTSAADGITANQIIQIGANIIDQYDTDSFPTRILFNGTEFDGVESLPYLSRVFDTVYRINGSSTVGMWYQPEVWNPHATASSAPVAGPTKFRFVTTGTVFVYIWPTFPMISPETTFPDPTSNNTEPSNIGIEFSTASQNFSTPTLLSPAAGATALAPENHINDGNANFVGNHISDVSLSDTNPNDFYYAAAILGTPSNPDSTPLNHFLQYWDGNQWITYSRFRNILSQTTHIVAGVTPSFSTYLQSTYAVRSDPRTDRFGVLGGFQQPVNTTNRPDLADNYLANFGTAPSAGWYGVASGEYLGSLNENLSTSATYYSDPDETAATPRPGDGAYTDGNAADGGYPLFTDSFNAASSRPLVLNRPFRSVAEMGYAARDEPWKSLDFFTSASADSALLDLFCLTPSPPPPNSSVSTDPLPIAGRVDLNTRQAVVLQALLTGASKSDETGTALSSIESGALAANLVALTTQEPLINRNELVTRWISNSSIGPMFTTAADGIIKRRREAAIRALADSGNVRTWNLLIDLVAQSGRYTAHAPNLNQFTVDGQRRYWVHMSIDRYTGKIVFQQWEPVLE